MTSILAVLSMHADRASYTHGDTPVPCNPANLWHQNRT